jgi:catechol 2,3-dioxygenase-like lactoylglutathione lyase family enzyme
MSAGASHGAPRVAGIHHVTAIAGDPQRNLDFYSGLLGLRLVKRTVNFDDPGSYHLYYGDTLGHPGTLMTFFPWPGAPRGRRGTGLVGATAFSVPLNALGFWIDRLRAVGVEPDGPTRRFEEETVAFVDPDGLVLELVAGGGPDDGDPWQEGPVPAEQAIRGLHSVGLWVEGYERTAAVLERLGLEAAGDEGNRFRFRARAGTGGVADLLCMPEQARGQTMAGTVHHVAWRASDEREQLGWRTRLAAEGLNVTPVLDRIYFRSIYFREPGGVLFEIATDPPGFTADEPPEALGRSLRLPPWLEGHRERIEQALPPLTDPA